jgi:hypothetical protein
MATLRGDGEPPWTAELATFDPEQWPSEYEWQVARVRFARARGFKSYRILPLLQAMARKPVQEQGEA